MDLNLQLMLALGLAVAGSLALGHTHRRFRNSLRGFFWGDNQLQAAQSSHLFVSTSFSMNGVVYHSWLGYSIGMASLWIQAIWCTSFLLMSLLAPKIARLARTGTMHAVIGSRFGTNSERAAALASIVGFVLQVGWELAVGVAVLAYLAPSDLGFRIILTLALASIAATYTILGGLRGNLRANLGQNFVAAFGLIAATTFLVLRDPASAFGTSPNLLDGSGHQRLILELGLVGLITNSVFSLLWQFVDMSAWQNLAATTEERNAPTRALLGSAFLVFLFPGLVGTLFGMALRGSEELTSDTLLPFAIERLAEHPLLCIFVVVGLIGALLSSIDGLLLASSQAVIWDLTDRPIVKRILEMTQPRSPEAKAEERGVLQRSRWAILLFALCGGFVVLWAIEVGISLFHIVYIVVAAQMSLVAVVLATLHGKLRGNGALSILAGLLGGLAFLIIGIVRDWSQALQWTPLVAIGLSLIFLWPRRMKG